jgi:hypothetical protein
LPEEHLRIRVEIESERSRRFEITATGRRLQEMIERLASSADTWAQAGS